MDSSTWWTRPISKVFRLISGVDLAKQELQSMLQEEDLRDAALLVFANK